MRWRIAAIVVMVIVGAGAWFCWWVGRHIEYPRDVKIMDVVGTSQRVSWEAPSGKLYSMLLATPGPGERLKVLRGTLRLLNGDMVLLEKRFGPDDLEVANWLDPKKRASVIIGKGPDHLDDVIAHKWVLDVELQLDQAPEFPVELWSSWLTCPAIEDDVAEARWARK